MDRNKPLSRRSMQCWCASLALGLLLCSLVQGFFWGRTQLQAGDALCADTLRLHIRADSDAVADQYAKLVVRDAVLTYLDAHCPAKDKPAAQAWAAQNLFALQLTAERTLARLGHAAPARVQLANLYFPQRHYPGGSLPAGRYDAVRIDIGSGRGHNWWCVLYPGLCRSACGGYVQPEENDLVCGDYILRFRLVDWWHRHTARRDPVVLVE